MAKSKKRKYPKGVEFEIECSQDFLEVRGNAMASGDDDLDKEVEDEIIERLNRGDEWAWCSVTVKARYGSFVGVDHLGGCSYKDEKDFIKNSGYYEDMKEAAYQDLLGQMEVATKDLAALKKALKK